MIIESGSDLLLVLNLTDEKGNRIRVASKNSFTIRVFTADKLKYLEYSKADIVTTNDYDKLYLNSNELERLESGVIAYTYGWGITDKNFNDGEYNYQKTVYTDYYLKNSAGAGSSVNPVDYKVIQQIKESIKDETDRATAVEGSLFSKMENHQTEVTNIINTEATERKDADTALEGSISTTNSNLDAEITRAKEAEAKALSDAKADAASKYQPKGNYLTSHQDISGKVDKVAGKGLSTNDYTTAEKNKLASLPDDFEAITDEDIVSMLKELGI